MGRMEAFRTSDCRASGSTSDAEWMLRTFVGRKEKRRSAKVDDNQVAIAFVASRITTERH